MRRTLALGAAALLAAPAAVLATAGPAAAADAQVSVLHGVPGATVDVYVDDKLTLDDFKPGELAGPLALPAGTYSILITDPQDKAKVVIGPADVTVASGGNYTVVAYLGTDGKPTAKPFVNDTSSAGAGNGRVVVRHVANAPEVTIKANGNALGNVANGNEISADVPAATYDVAVEPASGGDAVYTGEVPVADGKATIVYAWGDLAGGSFAVATQSVSIGHSAPSGVNAGTAGLADDTGLPAWSLVAAAVAGLVAVGAAVRLAGARAGGTGR